VLFVFLFILTFEKKVFCLESLWLHLEKISLLQEMLQQLKNLSERALIAGIWRSVENFLFFLKLFSRSDNVKIGQECYQISPFATGTFHDPTLGHSVFPGFFLPFEESQLKTYSKIFSEHHGCAKGIECLCRKEFLVYDQWRKVYYCDNHNKITKNHRNNYSEAFDLMYRLMKDMYQKWDTLLPTKKVIKFYETAKDGKFVICADLIEDDTLALTQICSKLKVLESIYPSQWYMPYVFRLFSTDGEEVIGEYFFNRSLNTYQEERTETSDYPEISATIV